VKRSQYATKKIMTQRINPSIPLPSMVKHACITAIIAAAVASDFHVERRFTRASLPFPGFSFIASHFLMRRFYNLLNHLRDLAGLLILQNHLQLAIWHLLFFDQEILLIIIL
jgi:hypothetical protein